MTVNVPGTVRMAINADSDGYINNSSGTPASTRYANYEIINANYFVQNYEDENDEISDFVYSILQVGGITGMFNRVAIYFN